MTARDVRIAIERCKEILSYETFAELSNDQKGLLCRAISVNDDPLNILLLHESFTRPLRATIKKHRTGSRRWWLDGVLDNKPQNRFETKEDAEMFAYSKGIELI